MEAWAWGAEDLVARGWEVLDWGEACPAVLGLGARL